jgi:hypothetical protein
MTAKRIVVVFEDHPNAGGGQGTIYTGDQLAAETSWYASMAAAYKDESKGQLAAFAKPSGTTGALGVLSSQQMIEQIDGADRQQYP